MKSFLINKETKSPVVKWGSIPDGIFFEGNVPEGYALAVTPGEGYIVIDVDRHGSINGFDNIPKKVMNELLTTLHYTTKNSGAHFWFKYSGTSILANKTSKIGIDLRVGNKGFVVFYPYQQGIDIRNCLAEIKNTSPELNWWLEKLFSYK